jgi:hypothetical protein
MGHGHAADSSARPQQKLPAVDPKRGGGVEFGHPDEYLRGSPCLAAGSCPFQAENCGMPPEIDPEYVPFSPCFCLLWPFVAFCGQFF